MYRTLGGATITIGILFSVVRALLGARDLAGAGDILGTIALCAVALIGVLALRAIVGGRLPIRPYVAAWAGSIILYVVIADVAAGFARPGLAQRLLVTAFLGTILGAVTLSVPPVRGTEASAAPR